MVRGFYEISNSLMHEICDSFEIDNDFNRLRETYYDIDYYVLYSILYSTRKYRKEIYDDLCQLKINDNKLLIISDTHYGSIYENIDYTYNIFNYCIANGIHVILHGGDIIESNVKPRVGFNDVVKQAEYFVNKFPFDKSINTYALLGNHDYSAINIRRKTIDILSSRNDINVLGLKKSFINWKGSIISIEHKIDNYRLLLPVGAENISFRGNSHFYHIHDKNGRKNEEIYIPALCDDNVPLLSSRKYLIKNKLVPKPGFLTAEIIDNNIEIVNYSINKGNIKKEKEYIKKLNI